MFCLSTEIIRFLSLRFYFQDSAPTQFHWKFIQMNKLSKKVSSVFFSRPLGRNEYSMYVKLLLKKKLRGEKESFTKGVLGLLVHTDSKYASRIHVGRASFKKKTQSIKVLTYFPPSDGQLLCFVLELQHFVHNVPTFMDLSILNPNAPCSKLSLSIKLSKLCDFLTFYPEVI